MLNLSTLFLSQKRLDEVLNREVLSPAARYFTLGNPQNSGLERRAVITAYEDAAIAWLTSARLPTLGELLARGHLTQGSFFTHIGDFNGRGILDAAGRFRSGRPINREAVLWTKLDAFCEGLTLTAQAHPENYTTTSAPGEMSGKKRLFLVGRLTECDTKTIRAQAYIVGHLHEEPRKGMPNTDRFGRLPWQMEVFPQMVDNFASSANENMPSTAELARMLTIPESEVKSAFASIIGERFIPKDWGGNGQTSSRRRCGSTGKRFQQRSPSRVLGKRKS